MLFTLQINQSKVRGSSIAQLSGFWYMGVSLALAVKSEKHCWHYSLNLHSISVAALYMHRDLVFNFDSTRNI